LGARHDRRFVRPQVVHADRGVRRRFPFLADFALGRAASAPTPDAIREELEERRWQLEWERRNVED
jgi:hypothetical protein